MAMFSECVEQRPQPEMASVNRSFESATGQMVAAVYACEPGYAWLSGNPFAVTQCLNGEWTPVLDACDVGEFHARVFTLRRMC